MTNVRAACRYPVRKGSSRLADRVSLSREKFIRYGEFDINLPSKDEEVSYNSLFPPNLLRFVLQTVIAEMELNAGFRRITRAIGFVGSEFDDANVFSLFVKEEQSHRKS